MTLEEINKQLLDIAEQLKQKLPLLSFAESAYQKKFFYYLLHSVGANAQLREAEARTICQTDGLVEPFEELKIEVRTLLHQKEILIEVAKNMRLLISTKETL